MPLYLMQTGEGESLKERLVEAPNIQTARNHIARDIIRGSIASPNELFRLAKEGHDIEKAGEPAPEPEPSVTKD